MSRRNPLPEFDPRYFSLGLLTEMGFPYNAATAGEHNPPLALLRIATDLIIIVHVKKNSGDSLA